MCLFSRPFYPWYFLFHSPEQSVNLLFTTVWVHIYSDHRPLLFPHRVNNQVHYQKFCPLGRFPLSLLSFWSTSIIHYMPSWPILESSSAFLLLQQLVIGYPLHPCGHMRELRRSSGATWWMTWGISSSCSILGPSGHTCAWSQIYLFFTVS